MDMRRKSESWKTGEVGKEIGKGIDLVGKIGIGGVGERPLIET